MTWTLLTFAALACAQILAEPAAAAVPTDGVAPAPDFAALASAAFTFAPGGAAHAPQDPPPASAPESTSAQPIAAAAPPSSGAVTDNPFFTRGSWRWQINLAGATDLRDDAFGLGGVAASYFIEDDFTIDFELNGLYFNQADTDDTAGLNLNMQLRYHFWRSDDPQQRWSLYADAGFGILFTGDDVPADSENFSFTPQAGMGFSLLLDAQSDARLLAGLRWHHTSNANIFEDNPGANKLMIYAGLNFPF